MPNIKNALVYYLAQKGIFRGFKCGQKPGAFYFEKNPEDGTFLHLKVRTIQGVFKVKGWKKPTAKELMP